MVLTRIIFFYNGIITLTEKAVNLAGKRVCVKFSSVTSETLYQSSFYPMFFLMLAHDALSPGPCSPHGAWRQGLLAKHFGQFSYRTGARPLIDNMPLLDLASRWLQGAKGRFDSSFDVFAQ